MFSTAYYGAKIGQIYTFNKKCGPFLDSKTTKIGAARTTCRLRKVVYGSQQISLSHYTIIVELNRITTVYS